MMYPPVGNSITCLLYSIIGFDTIYFSVNNWISELREITYEIAPYG